MSQFLQANTSTQLCVSSTTFAKFSSFEGKSSRRRTKLGGRFTCLWGKRFPLTGRFSANYVANKLFTMDQVQLMPIDVAVQAAFQRLNLARQEQGQDVMAEEDEVGDDFSEQGELGRRAGVQEPWSTVLATAAQ